MRNTLYFLFAILLFTVNCSTFSTHYLYTHNAFDVVSKRHIPIYIDKYFSSKDKISIDNAINQWNYALDKNIVLEVVDYQFDMEPDLIIKAQKENGWLILKVDSFNPTIPDTPSEECHKTNNCKRTLAWCDRVNGSVMKIVRDRIDGEDVEHIALHEIGHLLGDQHSQNKDALMYPIYVRGHYLCIDRESIEAVASNYGLNANTMNYCTPSL